MNEKRKIEISDNQLRSMVKEVVRKKIATLKEAKDFSARREVVLAAEKAAMDFEKVIIKTLNMKHPDELPTTYQKHYYAVVEDMKDDIVKAVMNAAKQLVRFPKREENKKRK